MECGVCKLDIAFFDGQRMHHLVFEFVGHLQRLAQYHGVHSLNVLEARLPDLGPQEGNTHVSVILLEVTR